MTELAPMLPTIISQQAHADEVMLHLHIPENLHWFKGHFPQQPILPGVVQLDWAIQMAGQYLGLDTTRTTQIEVLKFQVVITPGAELHLSLNKKGPAKFTFSFTSGAGTHASGRIKLV